MTVAPTYAYLCILPSLLLLLLLPATASAATWFTYKAMRNPGLVSDTASSHDECISKCRSTSGCSAVSWQQSSNTCLKSLCNSLDLYSNTGWNTFVLDGLNVEGSSFPATSLEWMLTDTCGLNNLGAAAGPKMNLYSVSYNLSASVYAGKATQFAGNTGSYGRSDANSNINNPMYSTSMTIMMWIYFNAATTKATLFEFSVGTSSRGILHWLLSGGLFFNWNSGLGTNCGGTCSSVSSWTPTAQNWHHVTFMYDGTLGVERTYLNSSLVGASITGLFSNTFTWNTANLGYSPFDTTGPMYGRMFCVKVFRNWLNSTQIKNAADSCLSSKVRISS